MIIWRGWGIIAVGTTMAGILLGVGLWSVFGTTDSAQAFVGVGMALSGVATFRIGRHMNETSVQAGAEKRLAPRKAQLDQLVASGQFQLAPGTPLPRSMAEAQQQADLVYQHEHTAVSRALRNRHTLFFIPFQWIGVAALAGGVIISISAVFTG